MKKLLINMTFTRLFRAQLFCLCFLFVSIVQAQDEKYNVWEINYNEGVNALESKDFENAKEAFINAITISELFSEIHKLEKVNTAFHLGRTFDALDQKPT